jgi:uridine phosphorylase
LHDDHVMGSTGGCGTELDAGSVVVASVAVVATAATVVSEAEAEVVSDVVSVDPQAATNMQATIVVTEARTSDRMGDGRRMSS